MLRLVFHVPSDKFQSALCYDALFNIRYAMLVLLCGWILSALLNIASFITLCSIVPYSMCCDASSTGLLLHIKCNVSTFTKSNLRKGSPHND